MGFGVVGSKIHCRLQDLDLLLQQCPPPVPVDTPQVDVGGEVRRVKAENLPEGLDSLFQLARAVIEDAEIKVGCLMVRDDLDDRAILPDSLLDVAV